MRSRREGASRNAFTIIETIIAAGLTILIVGALFALVRGTTRALAKASGTTKGERLLTDGIATFKSINYYRVFPMDSSQTNFGINGTINGNTVHPDSQVLSNFLTAVTGLGYSKFTVDVVYLHRDSTDSNGNGQFELIPFQDNGVPLGSTAGDKIDDWDPRLRYTDQNVDSDYFDTYLDATGKTVSESPNTDIKNVTLNLWKGNNIVLSHSFLLTNGLYSGENLAAADASLTLVVSTPPPSGVAYRYITTAQQDAFDLTPITYPYPPYYVASRADSIQPLTISGVTVPNGLVRVGLNDYTVITTLAADSYGLFAGSPAVMTTPLVEGDNYLIAFTSHNAQRSPYTRRQIRLDTRPPLFAAQSPTGSLVRTLSPVVKISVYDDITGTTAVSGICPAVLSLKAGGVEKVIRYNATTKIMKWIDIANGLPETLADDTDYTIAVEAGDYAHYRIKTSWTFHTKLSLPDTSSPPQIDSCSPFGNSGPRPTLVARIRDDESGVDPSSIVLQLDGVTVVSSALHNIADYFDPDTGVISFTPNSDLSAGPHNFLLIGNHWASDAPQTSAGPTCNFNVL